VATQGAEPVVKEAERLVLGRISAAYGIKGWVKIYSFTHPVEQILRYAPWSLVRGGKTLQASLEEGKTHGKGVIARFTGFETRNQAESLVGYEILVDKQILPGLDDGEYYWFQLQGLAVVNLEGDMLGVVDHLMASGANDIMVVRRPRDTQAANTEREAPEAPRKKGRNNDRLIPFIGETVRHVDLAEGKITVDWAADWD